MAHPLYKVLNLGIGSASHNVQMAKFMLAYDDILTTEDPDLVIVYGDTNTTSAAAIASCSDTICRTTMYS